MEVLVPTEPVVAVLRAIARAGFAYAATRSLCETAGWRLVDDERDLGYVRYNMPLATGSEELWLLMVLLAERNSPPWAFVPLFSFEEYDTGRKPFDMAFRTLAEGLTGMLGTATLTGEYEYPHRAGWSYSFSGWSLADAVLVLVQDEFDIQFGMDVTLWILPAGTHIQVPMM